MREELKKELEGMWKERQEVEQTKEETDDNFIPAKETKMGEGTVLVHCEL